MTEGDIWNKEKQYIIETIKKFNHTPNNEQIDTLMETLIDSYFDPKVDIPPKPKEFFSIFAYSWKVVLSIYTNANSKDSDWEDLIDKVLFKFSKETDKRKTEEDNKLRAMCTSYVMYTIPDSYKHAKFVSLRWLVHISEKFGLTSSKEYLQWFYAELRNRISGSIDLDTKQSKNGKQILGLFLRSFFDFFRNIEEFNFEALLIISELITHEKFTEYINAKDNKDIKDSIPKLFEKVMDYVFTHENNLFVYEILHDCFCFEHAKEKVSFEYTEKQKMQHMLLDVMYKSEDIKDLDKINFEMLGIKSRQDIEEVLKYLIFISIAYNKEELPFDVVMKRLNFKDEFTDIGNIVFKLNQSGDADLRIDCENKVIRINYCQPRIFNKDAKNQLLKNVDILSAELEKLNK